MANNKINSLRKGQEKYIEKAKKKHFSKWKIEVLKDDQYPVGMYAPLYRFLECEWNEDDQKNRILALQNFTKLYDGPKSNIKIYFYRITMTYWKKENRNEWLIYDELVASNDSYNKNITKQSQVGDFCLCGILSNYIEILNEDSIRKIINYDIGNRTDEVSLTYYLYIIMRDCYAKKNRKKKIPENMLNTLTLVAEHFYLQQIKENKKIYNIYGFSSYLDEQEIQILKSEKTEQLNFSSYEEIQAYIKSEFIAKKNFLQQFEIFLKYNETYHLMKGDEKKVDVLKSLEVNTIAEIPVYLVLAKETKTNINLSFLKYKNIGIKYPCDKKAEAVIYGNQLTEKIEIIISYEYGFYQKIKRKGKELLVPLRVKTLASFYNEKNELFDLFCEIIQNIFLTQGCFFIKDVIRYIKKGVFLPDLLVDDIPSYFSFNHVFKMKYPVRRNWNKNDINILYITYNMAKYVDESSKEILIQLNNNKEFDFHNLLGNPKKIIFRGKKKFGFIISFFTQLYKTKFQVDSDNQYILSDYIRMCIITKIKLNLRIKSISRLKREHDKIMFIYCKKDTPVIKIPPNSAFSALRKILPCEFEQIKTKERIIKETIMQHNCVWSYADLINNDKCAIYSLYYEPDETRYTIEFRKEDTLNYFIVQLLGPCNQEGSNNVYSYVSQFIK